MGFLVWSGLYSFIANLAIGVFVYTRNPKKLVNIFYALFSLTVSGWSFGSFLENIIPDKALALSILRINYLFAMWLPSLYIHFVYKFTESISQNGKIKLIIAYMISGIYSVLVFTPWFIPELRTIQGTSYYISRPGLLYYPFFAFFSLCMIEVITHTLLQMRFSQGKRRAQIKYITIANGIAVFAGFDYFSRVFGIIKFPPLDDYILVVYLTVLAYAILRYQVLDIEVIIKKTLVFAGLLGMVMAVAAVVTTVTQSYLSEYLAISMRVSMVLSGLAIILIYDPVRKWLVEATDKYLFQKKYNYHKLLKENSKRLALIQSLEDMAKQIVVFLIKQGRIKNAGIFLWDEESAFFHLKSPLGYGSKAKRPAVSLAPDHPLVRMAYQVQGPLLLEALEKKAGVKDQSESDSASVRKLMQELKAQVLIPSFLVDSSEAGRETGEPQYRLRNILLLGPKKSDEDYSEEDLDVFYTIAQDSAVAAENARLFDVVLRERESKLKAQAEAKMVGYAKTIGHEIKNALVGIEGPASF